MAPPVKVDPDGFVKAAKEYAAVHESLTAGISALTTTLAGCGGSAGSDNAGREWTNEYDPAAWDGVGTLGDLALACGQMHDLLHFTGANHGNADSQSGPNPNPDALVFPPGSLSIYEPEMPPAAFGGSDLPPSGWSMVSGYVQGELWPNGHPDRLVAAGSAWTAAASAIRSAGTQLPTARGLIEAQTSPEVDQALAQHDIVADQFDSLAEYYDTLANACIEYAASIESTKQAITSALVEMVALIAIDQVLGWGLAFVTGGGAAAAAQGGMALLLTLYGVRITGIIKGLRIVAEAGRGRLMATQGMIRGAELLIPLLRARPALAAAEGTAAPGSFTSYMGLRRPRLTGQTQEKILAATDRWRPKGSTTDDFYVVKAEPDVRVPVDKSYDNNPWVKDLPKSEDGRYYLDVANRVRYPVNPKWEIGHVFGAEHRRLLAEAQERGWTQKQFDDHVNADPQKFAVEDQYGNRSHQREMK
ncbi:GH-E family nuclease [Rhodococcoides yunnanense]|uniref:GH-E family nuclease n=1 Tax=Rhodococcoides yunnanense TaxID=278209 RepID=UPI0022B0BDFD|nr:GH-E family nuclease [Rhodococcus yunnanensis]MCZ4278369.1 GH-E family nuclease [Rhodococcus yunnanensis]